MNLQKKKQTIRKKKADIKKKDLHPKIYPSCADVKTRFSDHQIEFLIIPKVKTLIAFDSFLKRTKSVY